jgi:hypothetical protein
MKKRILCGFLGVMLLCSFAVLPAGAVEDDQAIQAVEYEDFSFDITVPPEGNEPISKVLYFYEKGVTEEGTLQLGVTDNLPAGVEAINFWIVDMVPTGYARTYAPEITVPYDMAVITYFEATLDFDDGTYGWTYFSGSATGLTMYYDWKTYSNPGTYTVTVSEGTMIMQGEPERVYPRDAYAITIDPKTISVS